MLPKDLCKCSKLKIMAVDVELLRSLPEELRRRKEAGELEVNKPRH